MTGWGEGIARAVVYVVTVALILVFFIHVLPPLWPLPYADDWLFTLPLHFKTEGDWWSWIIRQHVDHRIPIEKLVGFLLMRSVGFDFRYMVGLNFLLGCSISLMLLTVAAWHRGRILLGDIAIPLATLSFGANYTVSGIQFQFVSSMFFLTLFVLMTATYQKYSHHFALWLACAAILCCSLSGLNGLIASGFTLAGLAAWLLVLDRRDNHLIVYILMVVCAILQGILWISWTPTEASDGSFNLVEFSRFMTGLLPGSMAIYSFTHTGWKALAVGLLFCGAAGCMIHSVLRRRIDMTETMLFVSALACLAIIASISVGRVKAQGGWNPAAAIHYGFLSILIPLGSWIILSRSLSRHVASLLGIILTLLFARAFEANLVWRQAMIEDQAPRQVEILDALQQGSDIPATVDRYIADLTLPGDPRLRQEVISGIETLRQKGYPLYQRRN